ncbi:MAG TPA: hypothetical protein VKH15_14245 [Candidatus Acidoferrum sp.]|nr:hypothetical protein [Candidatus Acidoferrum sp.]
MKKHMVVLLAVVLLTQMTFAQSIGYTFTSEKDGVSCVFPDQHFVTDTTSYAPLVQHQWTAPDHSYVLIFQIKPPNPAVIDAEFSNSATWDATEKTILSEGNATKGSTMAFENCVRGTRQGFPSDTCGIKLTTSTGVNLTGTFFMVVHNSRVTTANGLQNGSMAHTADIAAFVASFKILEVK